MGDSTHFDEHARDAYWNEVVVPRVAAERAAREQAVQGRAQLVAAIEELLFEDDPIGINFGTNTDEYRAEAQSIVIRLPETTSEHGVVNIVHEVFVNWFDPQIAGPIERYLPVSQKIWAMWNRTLRADD